MANKKTQIAVAAILNYLGVDLVVDTKEHRLEMQKAIYLAHAAGVKLGYSYNWYVNGPYCAALADDYYEAARDNLAPLRVSRELEAKLKSVKMVIEDKPRTTTKAGWLEATASLDYMWRVQMVSEDNLIEACKKHKPHLGNILEPALGSLKTHGLID